MLYLAIDQHAKQITVCIRNEDGDTVLRRQLRSIASTHSSASISVNWVELGS